MPNGLSLVNLACWHVGVMKLGGRRAKLFGNWCHFMWTIQHWREIAVLRGDQIEICYDFIFLSLAFIWPWRVGVPGLDDLGFYLYLYLFYFIHAFICFSLLHFIVLLYLFIFLFPYLEYLLYTSCVLELCPPFLFSRFYYIVTYQKLKILMYSIFSGLQLFHLIS